MYSVYRHSILSSLSLNLKSNQFSEIVKIHVIILYILSFVSYSKTNGSNFSWFEWLMQKADDMKSATGDER